MLKSRASTRRGQHSTDVPHRWLPAADSAFPVNDALRAATFTLSRDGQVVSDNRRTIFSDL